MQVIDTHIGNVVDGMVTVEFRGEGGELVSVRMASDGSLDGDAAVRHAKALLVQVTAFGAEQDGAKNDELLDGGEASDTGDRSGSFNADVPSVKMF